MGWAWTASRVGSSALTMHTAICKGWTSSLGPWLGPIILRFSPFPFPLPLGFFMSSTINLGPLMTGFSFKGNFSILPYPFCTPSFGIAILILLGFCCIPSFCQTLKGSQIPDFSSCSTVMWPCTAKSIITCGPTMDLVIRASPLKRAWYRVMNSTLTLSYNSSLQSIFSPLYVLITFCTKQEDMVVDSVLSNNKEFSNLKIFF